LDQEKRAGPVKCKLLELGYGYFAEMLTKHRTGMIFSSGPVPRLPDTSSTRRVTIAKAFWETTNHGLPGDVDIRKDFGFDRCVSELEETNLLGLYRTMWVEELDAQELNGWLVEGKLAEKVGQWYEKVPEDDRGGYYLWFQQNPHIIP
jgi:hypothetical protein